MRHNANRRHHIPKMGHRATNRPQYEAALRSWGSLTLCTSSKALATV
jgi:hypothetical protein